VNLLLAINDVVSEFRRSPNVTAAAVAAAIRRFASLKSTQLEMEWPEGVWFPLRVLASEIRASAGGDIFALDAVTSRLL